MVIGDRLVDRDLNVDRVPGGFLYTIQRVGQVNMPGPDGKPAPMPFAMVLTTTFVPLPWPGSEDRELED